MKEEEIFNQLGTLIQQEKNAWEYSHVFVTERVAFDMRNLVRKLRKNYWGVFDNPIDSTTGREKIWVPLTESVCEAVVKNIDLDTKDINLRALHPDAIGYTGILRSALQNYLDEISFGEKLDALERDMTIDGTAIWKITEVFDYQKQKTILDIRKVDRLNLYVDPTEDNPDRQTIIERALLTPQEFEGMDGWTNTKGIEPNMNLHPNDENLNATQYTASAPFFEIFERWGLIQEKYITGNPKDTKMVDSHVVTSKHGEKYLVHLIEKTKGYKPYEVCWSKKIAGRFDGKGPAETLLHLQEWLNTVVNIRINRSYFSQLGIWKIRSGSNITPQMMARLAANGAIQVQSMEDIEQLPMTEASQASYADEDRILDWSQRSTQTYEAATGESLPSSTPATNAAIQSNAVQSSFVLVKEQIGMFLQRVIKRHVLPYLAKNLTQSEILRMTGEPDDLAMMDERGINELLYVSIDNLNKKGFYVTAEEVEMERLRITQLLQRQGKERFAPAKKIDPTLYDVRVYVTNEEMDKSVLSNSLTQILPLAPQYQEAIVKQIFDLMGLDANRLKPAQPTQPTQPMQEQPNASAPELLTQATTAQATI